MVRSKSDKGTEMKRINANSIIAACLAVSVIWGSSSAYAQIRDTPQSVGNLFSFLGALFSPNPTNLTKLIDEKKLVEADAFLRSEKTYFSENKKEQLPLLKRLASELNVLYEPRFVDAEVNLSKVQQRLDGNWKELQEGINNAVFVVKEYRALEIFKDNEFQSPKLHSLEGSLGKLHTELLRGAVVAFRSFDHSSNLNFFSVYPQNLTNPTFLNDNADALQEFVSTLSPTQIAQIRTKYSEQISESGKFNSLLLTRFLAASLPSSERSYSIGQLLDAIKAARAAKFDVKALPGAKIAFVEVTSKTLLKEGQIEFPTQIEMDLPFDSIKAEVDDIFDEAEKTGANYFIILDVATSKVDRRITAKNDIVSRFVSGTRSDPNPQYAIAQGKIFQAQSDLARAQGQYTQGIAAAILNAVAVGLSSSNLQKARESFSQTPPTISVDLHQSYKYSTSDVKVTRALTANYYVIDKAMNRYFKGIFDITENKAFSIAYNMHDTDPGRGQILGRFNKEEDMSRFEQSPMTLKASLLVEDYLKNQEQSRPLETIAKLREEMLADKNKALVAYKSEQFDAKPVNDPRFDSVVVILNPKGALGAGFFVTPDVVMTNYHVIEGAQFVEMKLYNGMETIGKVIKSDVRLDLALVKVQTRGNPLPFFEENTLALGATVEAIGHPKGLTFTITRGIVSAVRKKKSIYAVGGKEVMFVQTDAAINPGNSGGPLFLNNKVIGVNNNKLAAGSEGLGFAVHYSELRTFMKESF